MLPWGLESIVVYGTFMEVPASPINEMEAKLEVFGLELYYIAKIRVCEYRKAIVCKKVAIEKFGSWHIGRC